MLSSCAALAYALLGGMAVLLAHLLACAWGWVAYESRDDKPAQGAVSLQASREPAR